MTPTITLDTSKFQRELRNLMPYVKKDVKVVLKEQSRLLVKDCMLLTPAFGKNPLTGDTQGSQKRIQENAIRNDFRRLFKPLDELRIFFANGKFPRAFRDAIRKGDTATVDKMMHAAGFTGHTQIAPTATSQMHLAVRNKRGRVPKGNKPTFILNGRSIKGYLRDVLSHAGKAKSGWCKAAGILNAPVAPWIRRHQGAGLYEEKNGWFETSITVGNLVDYIQYKNREIKIMQIAVNRRANALKARIASILKVRLAKGSTP